MSKLTQGTKVYFIDNTVATPEVVAINCATSVNPGGAPSDQVEDTCLEDFERSYKPGLRTPGQATIGLSADPDDDGHLKLFEMSQMNPAPTTQFAIGWSDGVAPPTVTGGEFDLPATRTWFVFSGYVSDFPFDFQQNTIVDSQITIQRTGGAAWVKKSST